ncbi:pantetheine-phosphate adenylyltransferase [Nocardia sp. NPDC057227]|uniref:pantetheine-phosphate adenylyltransferase n=1 Tax=Nocardia sp. NPDC057227 TaxID=3346056 RepID=UPI0036338D10
MAGALCPGSFDPVTYGHLDVFQRVAAQFDEVIVTVNVNPKKQGMFTVPERIELLRETTADLPNVRIASWQGLTVDFAREQGVTAIVKGLRDPGDFGYELPMALMNKKLAGVDTFFIAADPAFIHLSSSLVKEVARFGGDVADMLPPVVHKALLARLAEQG